MRMTSKRSIVNLVHICASKGIGYAVLSPGSRNAPLIISLDEHPDIYCINIPDERVAGFFALGIAQQLEEPVILCCTSGSAGLNYAPAIVEAYYQKVPLLVLTADRPLEWIDQRAGQTMRQSGVFSNYVKGGYVLVSDPVDNDRLWYNTRIVNEAIDLSTNDGGGPVHINVPFREPLYEVEETDHIETPKIIGSIQRQNIVEEGTREMLRQQWIEHHKVLVVVGQHNRCDVFDDAIRQLAALDHVVVLTETTSNVCAKGVFRSIDRLIDSIGSEEYKSFAPDLIISCGGGLVSKKIRYMLREMMVTSHWHVDANDRYMDTYQSLTLNIPMMIEELVPLLLLVSPSISDGEWKDMWVHREVVTRRAHEQFLLNCPWSDLYVLHRLHQQAPSGFWHAANSTPVRYTQLFETRIDLTYRSNRGVSGIDGCTSTAMGCAFVVEEMVTFVTGDIAFFYDSNAFWHKHVASNIRVILINNGGGNIFRFVEGPMKTDQFEEHFEAHHSTSAQGIAQAYQVEYRAVSDEQELDNVLEEVYGKDYNKATIIEVFTPREQNIEILKKYFHSLRAAVEQSKR